MAAVDSYEKMVELVNNGNPGLYDMMYNMEEKDLPGPPVESTAARIVKESIERGIL